MAPLRFQSLISLRLVWLGVFFGYGLGCRLGVFLRWGRRMCAVFWRGWSGMWYLQLQASRTFVFLLNLLLPKKKKGGAPGKCKVQF